MSMYVTPESSGLYMENCWLWVADHDIDSPTSTRITVFAGRGLLIESLTGRIWLSASSVEHHTMYQYQLANTRSAYIGFAQTESPYYQPHPAARYPFPTWPQLNDPDFVGQCQARTSTGGCEDAWGMRVLSSSNVSVYGAGFYSFFDSYNVTCSGATSTESCQQRILSISGDSSSISLYDLSTVGTAAMVTENGTDLVPASLNKDTFADTLALYRI